MRLRSLTSLVAALILCIGACTANLLAQGTDLGTIRGTITDSTGAIQLDGFAKTNILG